MTMALSVVALVAVVAATLFTVQALSGVPLRGGIGDTQWRPTSAAQVAKRYELAVGSLTVDLRNVTLAPGTTHVKATVGVGRVLVEVPEGPARQRHRPQWPRQRGGVRTRRQRAGNRDRSAVGPGIRLEPGTPRARRRSRCRSGADRPRRWMTDHASLP